MIKTGSALSIGGNVLPALEQLALLNEFVVIGKPMTIAQLLREAEDFELVSTLQREYVQAPIFFLVDKRAYISFLVPIYIQLN